MSKLVTNDNLKAYHAELAKHIKLLQRNTAYVLDDIVNYDGITLKCTTAGTTNATKPNVSSLSVGDTLSDGTAVWTRVDLDKRGIDYYVASKNYEVDDQVVYDNKIYRCSTAHTSTSTFDVTKWTEISAGGGGISEWASGTSYSSGDLVIKDNVLYKANTTTSTTWVDSEWGVIGATFNTTSTYAQKIVTNVVAPYEMLMQVGDSNYCKPPIDVLKKTGGSDNVTLILENYNNTSAYTGTSDFLKIENSKAKLYNYKEYPITTKTLSTIDIGVSDEIDFGDFYSIDDSSLISCLHFDSSTTKDEFDNFIWSVSGSPSLSSSASKFGEKSVYLSSGDMISTSITPAYPIEIDFWCYLTNDYQNWGWLFTWGIHTIEGLGYLGISTESPYYTVRFGSNEWTTTGNISRNNWQHHCLNYDGETLLYFVDGTKALEQEVLASSLLWSSFTDAFGIANLTYNQNSRFAGYIDEFKILNTVRHTENFTPPTQPYTPNYNITSLEVN